jgi:PhnO protein
MPELKIFPQYLICELENKMMPETSSEKVFRQNLQNPCVFYWVYETENRIVGFISLHINLLLHHAAPIAEIQELVVKSDFRGKRIGAKLIEVAFDTAKKENCELLEVACNRNRTESHAFYEACRFERTHFKFVRTVL